MLKANVATVNSWPDSSVGSSGWTEFSGFKLRSDLLSMAASKNPSVVNTI